MTRDEYKKYLRMLGGELQKQNVTGEILVIDDVVVILDIREPKIRKDIDAYLAGDENAIHIPKDIDAYFGGHGRTTCQTITILAEREGLSANWFSDALTQIFRVSPTEEWLEYPGLRAYVPVLEHALAMRIATANVDDEQEIEDAKTLADKLHITTTRALRASVTRYITKQLLTSEMQEVIKEVRKRSRKRVKAGKSE